jgi:phage terminase small subunit
MPRRAHPRMMPPQEEAVEVEEIPVPDVPPPDNLDEGQRALWLAAPADLRPGPRALWREIATGYDGLEAHHLADLTSACRELSRAEQFDEDVEREGRLLTDRYGGRKIHPSVGAAQRARVIAAKLFREIGLEDQPEAPRLPRSRGYGNRGR